MIELGFRFFIWKNKWIKGECRHLCFNCVHYPKCMECWFYEYQSKLLNNLHRKIKLNDKEIGDRK